VEATKGENDKCKLYPNTFQWTEERTQELEQEITEYVHLKEETGCHFHVK